MPCPYCGSCKQVFYTSTDVQEVSISLSALTLTLAIVTPRIYLNNFIKHNYSKSHRRKAIGSSKTTPASSVIAQMDASDLNSRSDDNQDTNTNVCDSPNDVRYYDALRDPTLAENVGVVF